MGKLELRTLLVSVASIDAALPFYLEGLGLPLKFRDGEHYAALEGGRITVALATDADHPSPGGVALAFKTDDVVATVERLSAGGAEVITPAEQGEHEVRALLRDPAGTAIVVYGPTV